MPRYRDDWLIDRVMFDYVSGGSCACCGLTQTALFLPNGVADLVMAVSDIETDQAQHEIALLGDDDDNNKRNPWPKELRDQVWADRVRLRQHLKKDLPTYRQFWQTHGSNMGEWMRRQPDHSLQRLFQVSRTEISQILRERYNIHSVGYGVVLCAAMEQIAYFGLTQYDSDAPPGSIELDFEQLLVFDRRGGFTWKELYDDDGGDVEPHTSSSLNENVLEVWCRRFATLGGPKLLERGSNISKGQNDDNDDDNGDADEPQSRFTPQSGPSFQSDRRILRLVIARYWADQFMKKYLHETSAGKAN